MATHSSILARRTPCTERPARLQFRVTKSRTQLSDLVQHSTGPHPRMETGCQENKPGDQRVGTFSPTMAPHSSTLAWKIPWMEGPGGLQSMGPLGVGHDWATSLYFFTFMHWRRKWQPTPVFLSGESQGWQSLVGCHLWGRTESDTTRAT